MAVTTKRDGLEIDGLSQAVTALGRLNKEYKREAVQIFRETAIEIQKISQGKIGDGGYRGPKQKGMIGRSATATGAGVKLRASKYPWAYKAEYGEVVTNVYGPRVGQSRLSRRTAGRFRPPTTTDMEKNRGGYMIQPTIRSRFPWIVRKVDTDMTKLIDKAMRKAGVPDG